MQLELLKQYKLTDEGKKFFYNGELELIFTICTQIALPKITVDEIYKNGNMRHGYNLDKNIFLFIHKVKNQPNTIVDIRRELTDEEVEKYIDFSDCDNSLKLYEVDYSPFTSDKSINQLLIEENAFLRKIVDNFSKK